MLNWANGSVAGGSAPADFAAGWLDERRARAEKAEKSFVRAVPGDSPSTAGPSNVKDQAAAARRARSGRSGSRTAWRSFSPGCGTRSGRPSASPTAAGARESSERDAARMGDAQAPGVAASCARCPRFPRPARDGRAAAGRVRAAAPARPGAPAARRPAARARRHRPVQDRVPDQPGGRSRAPGGHRPLGGARRPRPGGRKRSRTPRLAARAPHRPVGDAADVRRPWRWGRVRRGRLAGSEQARLRPGTELHATCTSTQASPRCGRPLGSGTRSQSLCNARCPPETSMPCWPPAPRAWNKIPG